MLNKQKSQLSNLSGAFSGYEGKTNARSNAFKSRAFNNPLASSQAVQEQQMTEDDDPFFYNTSIDPSPLTKT